MPRWSSLAWSSPPRSSASRWKRKSKDVLDSIYATHGKGAWKTKLMINDRIADSIFQQIVTRPDEYTVLATPNLNGDYISDACAAQVGGLGIAPGANIGDGYAIFEATHGTAPKYADKDVINPGSVMLSGVMMFDFLGWNEAADLIEESMEPHHRAEESHLRLRAHDGRCHQGEDQRVRLLHDREHGAASSRIMSQSKVAFRGTERIACTMLHVSFLGFRYKSYVLTVPERQQFLRGITCAKKSPSLAPAMWAPPPPTGSRRKNSPTSC